MPKVSPSPSVHGYYKKEIPVTENDPSSTNNLRNLQFVICGYNYIFCDDVIFSFFCYNQNVRTDPATL